ncbi:MAG TPA: cell surface protein SprA [Saprospiraceae bacterium]|nr:cell surface protein SprA [Saprospiraceae bacterium]
MTKKNALLTLTGLLCLATLYAFSHPDSVRESVLTIFFPDRAPSVAVDRSSPNVERVDQQQIEGDTLPPLEERFDDFLNSDNPNMIDLKDPKAIEQQVEYDPETNMYIVTEKIGDDYYRAPTYMTFSEYLEWRDRKQQQEYFDRLQGVTTSGDRSRSGITDPIAKFDIKTSLVDRLFGGTNVDIRPQGNINLTFGFDYQKIQNPILTLRQQKTGNFDFDMDINMSASGKIGEKLDLNFNYNTQATFDFDNQMKLKYDTKSFGDDEILQNIEAGNVSMPLRSNLIKGAQNLFGIKTEMKFGHLRWTFLLAQQRSRQQSLNLQGGSQVQTYEKPIDEYDENRHFFLSQWNRNEFEPALKCLPVPQSLFNITRMEVWITNDKLVTENVRDVVALMDLAEPNPFLDDTVPDCPDCPDYSLPVPPAQDIKGHGLPDNKNNSLYPQIAADIMADQGFRFSDKIVNRLTTDYKLKQIRDFEKVRARLLSSSEYSYNEQLGFISVNLNVQPDQVVAVAVEYTYNGIPHKIGEFTSDVQSGDSLNQNVLFLKMLKSTTANVNYPIWDLMMKNVYAIGSANVDPNEFRFDIFYEDAGFGQKRFLNDPNIPTTIRSRPLLQVFGLDNLNLQADPGADGIFDFVPGLTINLRSGRIMFPVLEPFGKYLADTLLHSSASQATIDKYAYPQLYDSTLFRAREFQQLNRFTLKGSYKSSTSSEISLGTFNLPQGSVRVSAGGRTLVEGQDYTVDYNIGKVKILNDAILQSGQNVSVSFEDNTLFGFQSRTMFGSRFDYELSKDVNIGATFMNLFERPLTQKVNIGDDPINNKMYGLDFNISKDAPWLTKIVDKLPLISTKEPSSITAQAEFAALRPGHNKAINQGGDEGGTVYIDDFEGATANLPLANPANAWVIASTPQGDDELFPEASPTLDSALALARGANRAGITWYVPDPSARDAIDATNPYTRIIQYQDIFPNRQLTPLEQSNLRSFDVTVYPRDRGPYNFDLPETGYPGYSKGLTVEGELNEPKTRWAGIMRGLNTNDFEAANIEFVEFWMLNPYMDKADDPGNVSDGGDMYLDLGTLSEDIMRDSRQFFENALPTGQGTGTTAPTPWGRVPVLPPVVNAFDNDPDKRALQDLGLDGLNDENELNYFTTWIAAIQSSGLSPNAKADILSDPSNDNFTYYLDQKYQVTQPGLLARYREFNNQQGNSPVNTTQNLNPSATNLPDAEDLNRDNSLNESEAYFRYKIPLTKGTVQVRAPNGNIISMDGIDPNAPLLNVIITDTVVFQKEAGGPYYVWYRFKVPLDLQSRQTVGGIQDFRSIRFIRMFFKEFSEQTTFRFATLELGRNQWRRFTQDILSCDPTPPDDPWSSTAFEVNAVSIEENSARTPFNYTIPYGISREQSVGAFPDVLQNEQSLSMAVCKLKYCDARAVFKSLNMDLRQFKRLKMFVHAEEVDHTLYPLDSTDLTVFVRLGSDYVRNYYEYVLPLVPSNVDNLNGNPDSREYKDEVWRPENSFDFPLDLLTEVKKLRNAANGGSFPLDSIFEITDPNNPRAKVRVLGNPNLGYVKGAMIGVRNVDETNNQGNRHCVVTWFNEMRLNGFNEQAGWAGQARVDMKLADFGNISLAGIYTSIGWGSIEQKLIQRQREEVIQYDLSTNLELGKFLPERTGIKIPFYAQYSNITRNPEYDPYDLDIKLKDKLRAETDQVKRDSIRTVAQDITQVSGFNFTNVRKERRGGKKPMPWDISNFSFTYAFNQIKRRTPFIISDHYKQYKGGFDYQYSTGLKPFEPFKRSNLSDKWFKFIKEFNFNPVPNTYGFGTSLERITQATTWRFVGEDPKLNTYYNRRFTWDRDYDLGWDIARSLRFNFDAVARSLIDEPQQYKPDGNAYTDGERRDSIWSNIKNFGRPKNYMHNASLTWNVPLKFFPFLDWVSVKASYTAGYTWTAQSLKLQHLDAGPYEGFVNSRNLGNVIQNNNVRQINGDFDLTKLYDKSKYLAKINKPAKPGGSKSKNSDKNNAPSTPGGAPGGAPGSAPSGGDTPGAGGLGGMAPAGKDQPANPRDAKRNSADPSGGAPGGAPGAPGAPGTSDPAAKDKNKDKKDKDKKDKNKDSQPSTAERVALRPLMLIRKVRFTYSETYGTIVPGFTPEPKFMGLSQGFDAPGWAFVAGVQPSVDWLDEAGAKGWITHRPELNQQVMRNYTQNMDGGITLEPFQDFRVELTATRQYVKNNTELFKDTLFNLDPEQVYFDHRAQRDLGSLTVSYFSLKTLFNNDINGLFARYQSYRPVISNRLAQNAAAIANSDPNIPDIDPNAPHDDPDDASDYKKGYGRTQQEVLLPAFIAAYTEKDPNQVGLDVFKTMPAPNWRLTYNGLSKIGKLSKVFSSIQISHGYKSTLTVNSYNTDIFYEPETPYFEDELSFNYIARYEIPQVFINEQMAPLFGMDVKMKNDMTFKFDFKKSRTLAMSFIDYQLAETNSSGYSVGFGYRMKNVQIGFLTGKKAKKSKSKKSTTKPGSTKPPAPGGSGQQANDMNFKFDFEIRDDITVNHRLDQLDEAVPTRGARTISVNPSVEYALNKRLSLRLFTDYRKTVPKTSQSFPITTVNAGITVQFKLN